MSIGRSASSPSPKGKLTKEQALQKLRHFCRYQDRCHYDVTQKLWSLKVPPYMHSEILSTLIEEGDVNEERYTKSFVRGKFNLNDWGRNKIKQGLHEKRISPYVLKEALKEINEKDYLHKLEQLARKKYNLLKHDQYLVRKKKTIDYLLSKGYEPQLVMKVVEGMDKGGKARD
ncbi:MAG: regulatory protein RecX [Candidatus Dadabacteria bacterium]